ncbi:MAG: protein-disulfide reductase DsbD N-terminal domain-containing protein [Bryobacteraceae bacterium]|jgi:thiol:disulfide interchange protein DsbD
MRAASLSFALVVVGVCFAQEIEPPHVNWTLGPIPVAKAKRGSRLQISARARIDAGWHLYAEEQQERGPKALRMWLPENQPFTLSGPIKSPRPFLMVDPTFGLRVRYYQGDVTFVLPVSVRAAPAAGSTLKVNAYYQLCDDKICLPPRTHLLEAQITGGRASTTR